jgi:hypothetical protein
MNRTGSSFAKVSIFILGAAAIFGAALHFDLLASSVTATWSYDYGPVPACSTALSSGCIDHFELQEITSSQKLKLIQTVNNPPCAAGKIDGITTKFRYGPPFGAITISVVSVMRDNDGALVASNPYAARATVAIWPGIRASLRF